MNCQCGCGQPAPIAKETDSRRGHRKGQPMRYVRGHNPPYERAPRQPAEVVALYVRPSIADACWPWTGPRDDDGYGVVSINNRQHKAHRVAYEVASGAIPEGLIVRHSCDNPPCCNPAHLLVGTHKDNADDKVRRGRQSFGERHGQVRLTESDVIAIRSRRAAGAAHTDLAREFGVSPSNIRMITSGLTWKHVESA